MTSTTPEQATALTTTLRCQHTESPQREAELLRTRLGYNRDSGLAERIGRAARA